MKSESTTIAKGNAHAKGEGQEVQSQKCQDTFAQIWPFPGDNASLT